MDRLTEIAEVDKCPGIWVKEDFANKGTRTFFNEYDEGYSAINKCAEYEDLEDRLDKEFKGCIGVERIIDAFIEFYKQNDTDEELAEALLITNDSVRNYKEWKSLDEQGLIPKCIPGDVVYIPRPDKNAIAVFEVTEIIMSAENTQYCISVFVTGLHQSKFYEEDIGKTVFFTKTEAEVALKRMEGQDNVT